MPNFCQPGIVSKYKTNYFTLDMLISKCPLGVFKSSKKPTKFQNVCPSLSKKSQIKKVYESQKKILQLVV